MPQFDGTCEFGPVRMQSSPRVLSGLKLEENELPVFEPPLPPGTDLALFNVLQRDGGGHALIRIWIE